MDKFGKIKVALILTSVILLTTISILLYINNVVLNRNVGKISYRIPYGFNINEETKMSGVYSYSGLTATCGFIVNIPDTDLPAKEYLKKEIEDDGKEKTFKYSSNIEGIDGGYRSSIKHNDYDMTIYTYDYDQKVYELIYVNYYEQNSCTRYFNEIKNTLRFN